MALCVRAAAVFVCSLGMDAPANAQILQAHVASYESNQPGTGWVLIPGARLRIEPSGVSDQWVVLLSARLGSDSTNDSAAIRYRVNSVVRGTGGVENAAGMKGGSWQHFYVITGVSAPQTIDIQIQEKLGAGVSARVDDLNLIAFRVPAGADFHFQQDDSNQVVTGVTWTSYLGMTVNPSSPGDYLVLAVASTSEAPSNAGVHVRLQDPSAVSIPVDDDPGSPDRFFLNDRTPLQPFFVARRESLTVGSHTYTIEARYGDATAGQIEYQRLIAFRVDAFDDYQFDQDLSASSTTSTTPIVKSTVTTSAPAAFRDYLVIQSLYAYGAGSSTNERRVGFERDNVERSGYGHVFDGGNHRAPYTHFDMVTTDAAAVYQNTFSSSNGAYTVNAKESVIHVLRFPTATFAPQIGLDTVGAKEGGLSWGDFNEDGCLDLAVNTRDDEIGTRLYLQDTSGSCDGTFTDVTACLIATPVSSNTRHRSALWGDVNNDGRIDFIRNTAGAAGSVEIFFNNGSGTSCSGAVPWTQFGSSGNPTQTLLFGDLLPGYTELNTEAVGLLDYDADGDLDLVVNNDDEGILMFDNTAGTFSHTDSASIGLPGPAAGQLRGDYGAVGDIDMDGNVDVIQRVDNGIDLYINSGGTFSASAFDEIAGTDKGGVAFCDFDADGDFDLFWADAPTSQVWEQTGFRTGSYTARGVPAGITDNVAGVSCPDVDNDGDQDLFITTDGNDLMYRNDGAFSFTDITPSGLGAQDGQGTAFADYDRDGDVDLVINQAGKNDVWVNGTNDTDYLVVQALLDLGGSSRDAIGATIRLFDCDGNELAGMRDVNGGRGNGSQDPASVHFGLSAGNAATHVVAVRYVGGTTRLKSVVPSSLGSYQLLTITDTDADDVTGCPLAAVDLVSFGARGLDGAVEIAWRTGSEIDNLGFYLYRSTSIDGPYERLTDVVIPGLGSSPEGRSYRYVDPGLANGVTYYYKLEDIETTGARKVHGPVSATPQSGKSADVAPLVTYGEPEKNAFRIRTQTKREVVLELETHGFHVVRDETGAVRLDVPGLDDILERVPVKRVSLTAQPGRGVELDVLEARGVWSLDGLTLDDPGTLDAVANATGTVRLARRRRAPRHPTTRPQARVVDVGFMGSDKKAVIELAPVRWDARAERWELTQKLVVRIRFRGRVPGETARGAGGASLRRARSRRSTPLARFAVHEPGLYGVSYLDVLANGRRSLDTARLRLSRQGVDVAYHVEPNGSRFGPGSTLYFISDGSELNPYEDRAVYELDHGAAGSQMAVRDSAGSGAPVSLYWHEQHHEENRLYRASFLDSTEPWFWDFLLEPSRKIFPFGVTDWSGGDGTLSVDLRGASAATHHVRFRVNGTLVGDARFEGEAPFRFEADVGTALRHGENELELENVDGSLPLSMFYLDAFRVGYPRPVATKTCAIAGEWHSSGQTRVEGIEHGYVVEEDPPTWIRAESSPLGLAFDALAGKRYLVASREAVLRPERVPVPPARLRKNQQADYLAIGPRAFLSTAEPLLAARRRQGLRARAVAIEDVFSEFGFGEANPEAIRDFLAYAYHEWNAPNPRYVVLLGDGAYDYKNYLKTGVANPVPPRMIPSQSIWTASDPLLAAVNGDDSLPDLAVGRLPASSSEELAHLIAKILDYEMAAIPLDTSVWIVADDPDSGGDFRADARSLASGLLRPTQPTSIELGPLSVSEARASIVGAFDGGASLMSYLGHGGINLWADEVLLQSSDIATLSAQPVQPIVTAANCLNGYFHFPYFDSLAEALVKARDRGAIAVIAPSGLSLHAISRQFHRALLEELLSSENVRLGDALMKAQARYAQGGTFLELLNIYHLFGDPALRIARRP